ncbi:hypothetical protein LVD15_08260 [Fulvivirga maritima]|uniref:hypothetical protein n=1 Tax=Fulvivirga maritima TaxID=2904247 RepID=UPI001F432CBA|nr:hypothetical protein [Fulvivirga maritima]UII28409.1 hypothetical protein LVD15_08260 [Fulvivirga maritima]
MIKSSTFKGIEYVRVSNLPQEQKEAIQNWLNRDVMIKILTPEGLMRDCILYKDYKSWFEKIYTSATPIDPKETNSEVSNRAGKVSGLAWTNSKHL